MLADLVNGNDVGVTKFGGGGGFGLEAADAGFIGELPGEDEFNSDDAVEADLAGAVDHAHAAAGDFCEELVITERRKAGWWSFVGAKVQCAFEHAAGAKAFGCVVTQRRSALRTLWRCTHSLDVYIVPKKSQWVSWYVNFGQLKADIEFLRRCRRRWQRFGRFGAG